LQIVHDGRFLLQAGEGGEAETYDKKELEGVLSYVSTKFPVVTLTGPRQSGKSTLVRHVFSERA
jgi:predicted AAA+ superfamily ATPase